MACHRLDRDRDRCDHATKVVLFFLRKGARLALKNAVIARRLPFPVELENEFGQIADFRVHAVQASSNSEARYMTLVISQVMGPPAIKPVAGGELR